MIPSSHRPLLDADVATLATLNDDGSPHLSVVWFLAEGDTLMVSINSRRQKVRNLRRSSLCGVLVLDPASPYRYLEVRGRAEVVPDVDYVIADRIAAKYRSDFRTFDRHGDRRVGVTIHPTKVIAYGR